MNNTRRFNRSCTWGGVYTTFLDVLSPISKWWMKKAEYIISNWNTDGSADIVGAKAHRAHVTPAEIILYDTYGNKIYSFGGTR